MPVIVRDDAGNQIDDVTPILPAKAHTSLLLEVDKYTLTGNKRGTEFATPSGGQIGALGHRWCYAGAE